MRRSRNRSRLGADRARRGADWRLSSSLLSAAAAAAAAVSARRTNLRCWCAFSPDKCLVVSLFVGAGAGRAALGTWVARCQFGATRSGCTQGGSRRTKAAFVLPLSGPLNSSREMHHLVGLDSSSSSCCASSGHLFYCSNSGPVRPERRRRRRRRLSGGVARLHYGLLLFLCLLASAGGRRPAARRFGDPAIRRRPAGHRRSERTFAGSDRERENRSGADRRMRSARVGGGLAQFGEVGRRKKRSESCAASSRTGERRMFAHRTKATRSLAFGRKGALANANKEPRRANERERERENAFGQNRDVVLLSLKRIFLSKEICPAEREPSIHGDQQIARPIQVQLAQPISPRLGVH